MGAESGQSSSCCSPWRTWLAICHGWDRLFTRAFYNLGYHMALRPWAPCVGVMLLMGFICGFAFINVESRTEKLFVPQDSRAYEDLDVASKHFRIQLRPSSFLITRKDGGNVLTEEAFKLGLNVHQNVTTKTRFETSCFRRAGPLTNVTEDNCVMITPTELFDYNNNDIVNVTQRLTSIYNNKTYFMKDGELASENYVTMFGKALTIENETMIKSANVLRFQYISMFHLDRVGNKKNQDWEESFLNVMKSVEPSLEQNGYHLYYFAPFAVDESSSNSTTGDIKFVSISFTLMITLTTVFFTKPWMPSHSHGLMALGGISLVGMAMGVALGFCMIVGVTFVGIVGVLPFVVIGVAIDDIFVVIDTLDRTDSTLPIPERIATAMSRCGATITMTTLTDLFAFGLSTTSKFPAIRYFCIYGIMALFLSYLFIITCFVAFMAYDLRRIKANRLDYLFCIKRIKSNTKEEAKDQSQTSMSTKVMTWFGTVLMKTPVRVIVIIFSLCLLAAGIYGTTTISQKFDLRMLGQDGSYYIKYLTQQEEILDNGQIVSVVTTSELDYTQQSIHDGLAIIGTMMADDPLYVNKSTSWIYALRHWASVNSANITGPDFYPSLQRFLNDTVHFRYRKDLDFDPSSGKLAASRVLLYLRGDLDSMEEQRSMGNVRTKADTLLPFKSYPITYVFIYYEQFAITLQQTLFSLAICTVVIAAITALYVVHPGIVVVLLFSFVGLIVELFGLMAAWDVNLNSISMVCLVMAIGFAVDYSAHVAHAYATSPMDTPEERAIDALSRIGSSVFMGGFSTAAGIASLGFASSGIFRIFFKMFLGIVGLGLLNGLVINPVYMSIFCRTRITKMDDSYSINGNTHVTEMADKKTTGSPRGIENPALARDV